MLDIENKEDFFIKYTVSDKLIKRTIKKISSEKQQVLFDILYNFCDKSITPIQSLYSVLKNIFLGKETKEEFLRVFCILQKIKNAFSRFIRLIKYKKARIYNNTDLFGDSFTKNTMIIFENNTKYVFQFYWLYHLLNNSIFNDYLAN